MRTSTDGQRTKCSRKIAENYNQLQYVRNCAVKVMVKTTTIPYHTILSVFSERHVRYMISPVRLSVVCLSVCRLSSVLSSVCNVRAPYSGNWNFRQYFCGIRYFGHPLTFTKNFPGDRPRGTPPPGELNTRWVVKYSDFGPIDGYISETVQDRR